MSSVLDPLRMSLAGVHSINASAGTGKTYTITTLYLRYLLEARCSVDDILVTTFTEAATAELKERLRKRLRAAFDLLRNLPDSADADDAIAGGADEQLVGVLLNAGAFESESRDRCLERLEDALLSFDQAPVFTIHGFCNQVLQQLVFETGSRFQFELLTSQEALIEEALQDFVARWWTAPDSPLAQWLPLKADLWDQLKDVAKKAVDNPADRIVPESPGNHGLPQESEIKHFDQQAREFGELWSASQAEIEALFAAASRDDVLKQNSHKPEQITRAIEFINEFAMAPSPFVFKWDDSGKLDSTQERLAQSRLAAAAKKGKEGSEPQHRCFEMYEELLGLAQAIQEKAEGVRVVMFSKLADFVRQHVTRHKDEHGKLTFSDMLHLVDEALGRPDRQSLRASLRERYRVAMVDEFQDTDPVQFRIFRRIFLDDAVSDQTEDRAAIETPAQSSAPNMTMDHRDDESADEPDDSDDSPDFDPFRDVSSFYDDAPEDEPQFYEDLDSEFAAEADSASPDVTSKNFRAFVMIGDPKQSIYKFRGADLNAYLSAIAAVPDEQRHQMDRNWRSDDSLVRAVQSFFQSIANPFLSNAIELPPVTAQYPDRFTAGPAFEVRVVPRRDYEQSKPLTKDTATSRVLEEVAADIVRKINGELPVPDGPSTRPVEPGDIAVLCRTRMQLVEMQHWLADRGVPAVLHVDESVYATIEATEVSQMLQAILQASGGRYLATALRTAFCGLTASEIEHALHDDEALALWSERLRDWNSIWLRDGFIVMWRRLLEEQRVVPRLAGQLGGERQITNFLHLGELLHEYSVQQHAGPEELLRWFDQMRFDSDDKNEAAQLRLETDSEAVQLITIHKSKGLEYPIVYCPMLWAERDVEKDKRKVQALSSRLGQGGTELEVPELDVGSDLLDDRRDWDATEQLAEQRRLLYVALTRARHQCVLHWIAGNGMSNSAASQFMCPDWDDKASDADLSHTLVAWAESLASEPPTPISATSKAATVVKSKSQSRQSRIRIVTAGEMLALKDPGHTSWSAIRKKQLANRAALRPELPAKRQTSYSALVRMLPVHAQHDWTDRDDVTADTDSVIVATSVGERTPLADMPGGTRVGDVVHRVLEKVLLDRPEPQQLALTMQRELSREMRRAALDIRWLEPLAATMTATLLGRLDALKPAACLLDVPHEDLTCEMPFVLRLGQTGRELTASDFDLGQLAECFAASDESFIRDYAERVRGLDRGRISGLLVGFIDVVFCWQGRWYVVDYKTTNLGPRFSDYSSDRLAAAMADHDYILQYHLYAVAVTQFLAQRLPDFDAERDFGGVLYYFLRGTAPGSRNLGGVYYHRPQQRLVAELTSLMRDGVARSS